MSNVPYSVTVTAPDGRSATVRALPTTTISALKELIAQSPLGVPADQIVLETEAGAGVNWPNRSLRACGIFAGARLHLRPSG